MSFSFQAARKHKAQNFVFSPLSISIALGMVHGGAQSDTAEEMKAVMKLTKDPHSFFKDLMTTLKNADEAVIMKMANMLYVKQDFKILDTYKNLLKESYKSGIQEISMNEAGRGIINSFVEETTNSRIKDLIPSGVLNDMTRLVLVNAVYFKGKWAEQFNANNTRDHDFHVTKSETVKVPMMYISKSFPFGRDKALKCTYIKLPYIGDELEMLFVLPDEIDGLKDLEEKLTGDTVAKWSREARKGMKVDLHLPRFKIEGDIPLKQILQEMGMVKMFSDNADFSGMDGKRDLYVSDAFHKAFIEVNEEGTEAAAATGTVLFSARASGLDIEHSKSNG
ncbi:unnamed protein product [Darwinula stevensoni]|uniref:Serpin domain-containing protein n=1 Tax=Darwinula stevensoni TaxID=69355 RepID=A0A7R8XDJ9_9CRUS|nr:unnamed protein product [Darwinula stevensoni]CAG0893581.1 unnamed protein product [Darwinula stevensoni]